MANKKKAKAKTKKEKEVVVAVSGGFDPIHVGHVRMFNEAKKLGHKLIVIINNDNWLRKKKGFVFMPEHERKEVIEALGSVDAVFITEHAPDTEDMSVCEALRKLRPHIFANGGDRKLDNIPEIPVCEEIGCQMIFNMGHGGKVQSSSWLVKNYQMEQPCHCGAKDKDGRPIKSKYCHGK